MRTRGLILLGSGAMLALLTTGCHASASIGAKSVSQSTVEQQTAKILADQYNQPLPTVACPGDLDAKVGATMTCQLTPQGSTEKDPVDVTVTSISGGVAHFSVSVSAPAS